MCAILAVSVTAAVALPAAAQAKTTRSCKSGDLRYPFQPGGPKTFGVFKLRITGGKCKTGHRVAKGWMDRVRGQPERRQGQAPEVPSRASPSSSCRRTPAQTYTLARAQGLQDDPLRLRRPERLTRGDCAPQRLDVGHQAVVRHRARIGVRERPARPARGSSAYRGTMCVSSMAEIWEEVLPPTPEDVWRENAARVAEAMRQG